MTITRRNLIQMLPASAAAMSLIHSSRGAAADEDLVHAVVVGGGFAGCTAAKYLKLWGGDKIAVTLVEPRQKHFSCIMSNLVLENKLRLADLAFDYATLRDKYGVNVLHARASLIRGEDQVLELEGAESLPYDHLVVATGINFARVDGLDHNQIPHAWIAGPQTNLLRDQIRNMPDNGTFVMTIPRSPYRCPPGPYERACLVAGILGQRSGVLGSGGRAGAGPRVIVLDANPGITAEKATFTRAFEGLYGDIIEYLPNTELSRVDSANKVVYTTGGAAYQGDVVNVIPPHRAANLLLKSGLAGGALGPWAPVDPVTYASTVAGFPGVHVIGDGQGTGQPKSGHMANSQAKICADAIVRDVLGLSSYTEERLANLTTNSACFSPITDNEASWLTAVFAYDRDEEIMKLVPGSLGEAREWNSENYADMFDWSANLFKDTFG